MHHHFQIYQVTRGGEAKGTKEFVKGVLRENPQPKSSQFN